MNWVEKAYKLTDIAQTEPQPWDGYHIAWCVAVLLFSVVLSLAIRNSSDKVFRRTILVMWLVMLAFEIYKQIFFSAELVDGAVVFSYNWTDFPFQLCSTPLYVLPILAFLKDSTIRDFAASYTASYALIGGIAVYLFPSSVFCDFLIGNLHTMTHHGIQISTGIITAEWYRKRINKSFFFKGVVTFAVMFTVAMLLNTVFRDYLVNTGRMAADETFNMFLINPYMEFSSPAFEDVLLKFSPWGRVALYFFGLPVGAAVVTWLLRLILNRKDSYAERA